MAAGQNPAPDWGGYSAGALTPAVPPLCGFLGPLDWTMIGCGAGIPVPVISTDDGHGDKRLQDWADAYRSRLKRDEEDAVAVILMAMMD